MQYHVYITPSNLYRQLTTVVELPATAIELPRLDLDTLIRTTIKPLTNTGKTGLFNHFTVDGLREVGRVGELPTPAWLASTDTENAIVGHNAIFGGAHEFLWSVFLDDVLCQRWMQKNDWAINSKHLGYPVLELDYKYNKETSTFGDGHKLCSHTPKGWTLSSADHQGHLSMSHPSIVTLDMHNFLNTSANMKTIFPARTHPLFYVALYEFWKYLSKEPLWAYLPPLNVVKENPDSPEFNQQSLVNFGTFAATYRWSWWLLMSHVFSPRSRALDILVEHYPQCYEHNILMPHPIKIQLSGSVDNSSMSTPAYMGGPFKSLPRIRNLRAPHNW